MDKNYATVWFQKLQIYSVDPKCFQALKLYQYTKVWLQIGLHLHTIFMLFIRSMEWGKGGRSDVDYLIKTTRIVIDGQKFEII